MSNPITVGTDYSNAFQSDLVLNALVGRIGWQQPTVAGSVTLTGENIQSASGSYFQDFHSIVTPGNIQAVQEDPNITATEFNALLLSMQQRSIMKALRGVFRKKELLERKLLFERFGRQDYQNPNAGAFVGVRILPPRDFDMSMQIDSVSLYFDTDITFNLYLFHDAKRAPVWVQQVTAVAWQQTVVNFEQFVLNYFENNKSGVFYLGYFQDDLGPAMGINEIVEKFNRLNHFGLTQCELQRLTPGVYEINFNYVAYSIKTHGLNLQCSAFRDHTQQILMAPYMFDTLIGLQMAADVIELIQNSVRSNLSERITKELSQKLYNDLNLAGVTDNQPYSTGLKNQIQAEVNRVRKEFFPKCKPFTVDHDTDQTDIYGMPEIDVFRY